MWINFKSVQRMLTVTSAVLLIAAPATAQQFSDDFERSDGPVDGWTVHQGQWDIAGGGLETTSAMPGIVN